MVAPNFRCCERVYCIWRDQRSLLMQTSVLQLEMPYLAGRRRSRQESRSSMMATSNPPTTEQARGAMRMSFDIHEAVFDAKGTYMEEKALRYEHDLMDQFAASP